MFSIHSQLHSYTNTFELWKIKGWLNAFLMDHLLLVFFLITKLVSETYLRLHKASKILLCILICSAVRDTCVQTLDGTIATSNVTRINKQIGTHDAFFPWIAEMERHFLFLLLWTGCSVLPLKLLSFLCSSALMQELLQKQTPHHFRISVVADRKGMRLTGTGEMKTQSGSDTPFSPDFHPFQRPSPCGCVVYSGTFLSF